MIKSVRIEPITLEESSTHTRIFIEFDTADLYLLYQRNEINTENITVQYITEVDGEYDTVPVSLYDAYNEGIKIGYFADIEVGY